MQGGAAGAVLRGLAMVMLAMCTAGCVTDGQRTGALPADARSRVAFESIDGAPPAVFQKLVQKLSEEAEARQVPMVTRTGYAPYRIRGYIATSVVKKQAVVSWVWDVYDGETRRAARLSGEEPAGPAGQDAWSVASDDAVLARVARSGMAQLAAFLAAPAASPGAAPVPEGGTDSNLTVAAADGGGQETAVTGSIAAGSDVLLPPRRPAGRPQQVAAAPAR